MAGSVRTVQDFLDRVLAQTQGRLAQDKQALLETKRKFHEQNGLPFDGKLHLWDVSFFDKMYMKNTFGLDEKLIKEYFPLEFVLRRVFEMYTFLSAFRDLVDNDEILCSYEQLFSLRFEQLDSTYVWHESVKCYAVFSRQPSSEESKISFPGDDMLVGYFFLGILLNNAM
jgi:Zn-dependent oligopeptidase